MKKLISIIVLVICCILLADTSFANAADDDAGQLFSATAESNSNIVTVTVTLKENSNITNGRFAVESNSTTIILKSFTTSDKVAMVDVNDKYNNGASIAFAFDEPITESVELATLSFEVKGAKNGMKVSLTTSVLEACRDEVSLDTTGASETLEVTLSINDPIYIPTEDVEPTGAPSAETETTAEEDAEKEKTEEEQKAEEEHPQDTLFESKPLKAKKGVRIVKKADGTSRIVNGKGKLLKNTIVKVKKSYYYVNGKGIIVKKKLITLADGTKVYATKTGKLAKGKMVKLKNAKTVYCDENGRVAIGLFKVKGTKYYANKKGYLQKSKWVTVGDKKYYCSKKFAIKKTVALSKSD